MQKNNKKKQPPNRFGEKNKTASKVITALEITTDQRSNIGRNFTVIGRKYLLAIIMIGSFL